MMNADIRNESNQHDRNRWITFVASVLLIKFVLVALDGTPKFFFGDSECYVCTGVLGWIPPDRSFTYGYVIRLISLPFGSFTLLIALQVLASGLSAILLAFALRKYFATAPGIACLFGLLCTVEPTQVLYERYVMTETLALTCFVLYVIAAFQYLSVPKLRTLCLIHLIGVALISLRISFLPLVLSSAILLPFMAPLLRKGASTDALVTPWGNPAVRKWPVGVMIGVHLAVSVAATGMLHAGYKRLFAVLSGHPAGYNAAGGLFLAAIWAPVIEPSDFPYPELRSVVFDDLRYDLKDRATRADQRFSEGGLINRIETVLPGPDANRAASRTAVNALLRDPTGIVMLSVRTYLDYFNASIATAKLMNDLALDQSAEYGGFRQKYRTDFPCLNELANQSLSFTKKYYLGGLPWYWLLLISPLVGAAALWLTSGQGRVLMGVVFIALCAAVATAAFLTVHPVVRYLHPVSWLFLCVLGVISDKILMVAKSSP